MCRRETGITTSILQVIRSQIHSIRLLSSILHFFALFRITLVKFSQTTVTHLREDVWNIHEHEYIEPESVKDRLVDTFPNKIRITQEEFGALMKTLEEDTELLSSIMPWIILYSSGSFHIIPPPLCPPSPHLNSSQTGERVSCLATADTSTVSSSLTSSGPNTNHSRKQ